MQETLEDFALSKRIQKKGSIQKVAVIGCGSMGQEIARTVAQHGMDVVFIEISEAKIMEVFEQIEAQLDEIINHWGLTKGEKRVILSHIKGSVDYNDIRDADLVIESINTQKPGTNIEMRKNIFRKVEEVVAKDVVITSNNSTLMISEIASVLEHPERAAGLHFISPSASIKIVEVVRGIETNDATFDFVMKFASMIEKQAIIINESPGHISSRLIVTLINEACEILMEGVSNVKCIDTTMKMGYGLLFGPFEMADRIGLDNLLKWMDNLYGEYGMQKFKASPIIKRLVRAGYHGMKAGKGFYKYENGKIISQAITATEFN
ncbi:MAG: 3-hydroxyacyl-CoA dehydrogenase family protein [Bacteroidales bacterium]|nr:3-hydroxyacyl-CoA dehydrogenase family protein [Bacteroidales bacterium]MCB9013728.1 3-hydroxyacyl-CoA dehydrogenase family protein [Bacteroidales bacterium]